MKLKVSNWKIFMQPRSKTLFMKSIQTGNSHQKFSTRHIEDNIKLLALKYFVRIESDIECPYSL
jgi:hypothetical protein